jgi:hypothetical protein
VIDKEIRPIPGVRVITYDAFWETKKCKKVGEFYELEGIEKTLHRIEFQLENEMNNYKHVANGYSSYKSKVTFDSKGEIAKRYIVDKPSKQEKLDIASEYEIQKLEFFPYIEGKNTLKIIPTKETGNKFEENQEYKNKIAAYDAARKDMHWTELSSKNGCTVITTTNQDKDKPTVTIAFLCPKHARIMKHE